MTGVMARRFGLNVLMLLLVMLLAGGAWWYFEQGQAHLPNTLMPTLKLSEIEHIEIVRRPELKNESTLRFVRRDKNWWLTKPQQVPVKETRIRLLLTLLESPISADYAADEKDLKQFALEPGLVQLSINEHLLILGQSNPVSGQRYVLHNNRILLLDESVFANLAGDWLRLVSPRLVAAGYELERVALPDDVREPPDLITAWQNAEAVYLEHWDARQALKTLPRVRLHFKTQSPQDLYVLMQADELRIIWPSQAIVYVFPASQSKLLLPMSS